MAVRPGLHSPDAVSAAYAAFGGEIYRLLLRGLGDEQTAQDVTQETFLKAWRTADRYDPEQASLRTWLFHLARNVLVDHLRAARARPWQSRLVAPATDSTPGQTADLVEDSVDQVLDSWLIEEALRRIAPHHRVAIVETHLRERPYGEVASDLGIPVGTLRSRVFYALKALRNTMDEMGVAR